MFPLRIERRQQRDEITKVAIAGKPSRRIAQDLAHRMEAGFGRFEYRALQRWHSSMRKARGKDARFSAAQAVPGKNNLRATSKRNSRNTFYSADIETEV